MASNDTNNRTRTKTMRTIHLSRRTINRHREALLSARLRYLAAMRVAAEEMKQGGEKGEAGERAYEYYKGLAERIEEVTA